MLAALRRSRHLPVLCLVFPKARLSAIYIRDCLANGPSTAIYTPSSLSGVRQRHLGEWPAVAAKRRNNPRACGCGNAVRPCYKAASLCQQFQSWIGCGPPHQYTAAFNNGRHVADMF